MVANNDMLSARIQNFTRMTERRVAGSRGMSERAGELERLTVNE